MRTAAMMTGAAALAATALAGGSALAEPEVEIRDAVARVTVVPQDRADVQVQVTQGASALPRVTIRRRGDTVVVDGGLGRGVNCRGGGREGPMEVTGRFGRVTMDEAPRIVVLTPRDVRVSAGPAVTGEIGRSRSLELSIAGCGDWTAANVQGELEVATAGSGSIRTGSAGSARISAAGSGDVAVGAVGGGLTAQIAGSGDVRVASVSGDVTARVAGSGDVRVDGGRAPELSAQVAGSGDVVFGGRAGEVDAAIAGSGDVRVREAGSINRRIVGSGDVVVGPIGR